MPPPWACSASRAPFWCPQTPCKIIPWSQKIIQFFLQNPSLVLSCFLRRSPTRGLSVSPSSWAVGALPCISHSNSLHPISLLSAEVSLPGKGGLFSLGRTSLHPQTESASLTMCDDVLQCKAHPQAFPTISTHSPSLLLDLCYFFSFQYWICFSTLEYFYFSLNKHLFFNTIFDLSRWSSSGDRLVTGAVKWMKSLLLSLMITGLWPKGESEWKNRTTFSYSNNCVTYWFGIYCFFRSPRTEFSASSYSRVWDSISLSDEGMPASHKHCFRLWKFRDMLLQCLTFS